MAWGKVRRLAATAELRPQLADANASNEQLRQLLAEAHARINRLTVDYVDAIFQESERMLSDFPNVPVSPKRMAQRKPAPQES